MCSWTTLVDIGGALGISQIILGVTAAAIGTSLPEFGSGTDSFTYRVALT